MHEECTGSTTDRCYRLEGKPCTIVVLRGTRAREQYRPTLVCARAGCVWNVRVPVGVCRIAKMVLDSSKVSSTQRSPPPWSCPRDHSSN